MTLKSKIEVISTYKGKSKFDFWKKLCTYDLLEVSCRVAPVGRGSNGLYAGELLITNLIRGTTFSCSMTEFANYLKQLEYNEL